MIIAFTTCGVWLMHSGIDPAEELDLAHLPPVRHELAADVKSWRRIADAPPDRALTVADDLIVVDAQAAASWWPFARPAGRAVGQLKVRDGGNRRLVIATLPIGADPVATLDGDGTALVERLMDLGFDGVLLTGAAERRAKQPDADARLIERIGVLAAHAKVRNPDALVGLEGAVALLESRRLRAAVDFIAIENLLYEPAGRPRLAQEVAVSVKALRKAQQDGVPILVAERLETEAARIAARRTLESYGFIAEATLSVPTARAGAKPD